MMATALPPFPKSALRSLEKVRELPIQPPTSTPPPVSHSTAALLPDDDSILLEVKTALKDGFGGVILSGPPGTSKTYYAQRIAQKLAGDRVLFIQFHPSYQYDDFVEGMIPEGGGFKMVTKHFLNMCESATKVPGKLHILVIDELSRTDPARVFGEALTYIESTKRGQPFSLASGRRVVIPENLIVLATMNIFDRGVDEVDAAFDRRFAKVEMAASPQILEQFLNESGMESDLKGRVLGFFRWLQRHQNPHCRIGHTYFRGLKDVDGLRRRWKYQLHFVLEKALRVDPAGFRDVQDAWERVFTPGQETPPGT